MSKSSLIRGEVRELSLEGRDINVRSLARKYKCSPSLVVKNVYKVEKEENYKHITKFGVKGKVNLVIIDFDEEKEKDLTPNSHFDCSPHLTQNSHFDCLPTLSSNSHSESPPHLKEIPPFDCLPHLKETPHSDCLPHLKETPHSDCSPPLTPNPHFESLPPLKQNPHFQSLPTLKPNSPLDCSPLSKQNSHLSQDPNSESPPHLKENNPFDCTPHLKENSPFDCLPHLTSDTPFDCLPPLTPNSHFDCSPHSKQNNHSDCSPHSKQNSHLTQDPNSEYTLFNVHQNSKEKEKVSYNLLKEKEHEKFINKFLSISQIDSLTSLNKYEKEILKTYIKYGGKLKESEIKFGKEILFYATPKQFEAILLKVIRDKKGETPRISYLCEVVKRFNLKSRKKKATPKLFEKVKTFNKSNVTEKNKSNVTEKSFDKELTSTFSYLGLTGEDALKAFFGESFKKENFVGVLNG